jgi:hypothetical protein
MIALTSCSCETRIKNMIALTSCSCETRIKNMIALTSCSCSSGLTVDGTVVVTAVAPARVVVARVVRGRPTGVPGLEGLELALLPVLATTLPVVPEDRMTGKVTGLATAVVAAAAAPDAAAAACCAAAMVFGALALGCFGFGMTCNNYLFIYLFSYQFLPFFSETTETKEMFTIFQLLSII